MATDVPPPRTYDKGERRFKHVGRDPWPEIQLDDHDPKKWIGKCPSNLSRNDRDRLLNHAVATGNGDRELDAPWRFYAVHEGAIYEAQTSDGGMSYHGHPYCGKLPGRLIAVLRAIAIEKGCVEGFDAWVKKHIVRHGGRS